MQSSGLTSPETCTLVAQSQLACASLHMLLSQLQVLQCIWDLPVPGSRGFTGNLLQASCTAHAKHHWQVPFVMTGETSATMPI